MGKFRKVYVPNTLLGKEEKRRHKKREWKHIYFFKGNRYGAFNTPIIEEWTEPIAIKSYNQNTLYKVKELSDELWDYYKILKTQTNKRTAQIGSKRAQKRQINKKLNEQIKPLIITHDPVVIKF